MPGYHPRWVLRHFAHSVQPSTDAERADKNTSMADARTALCFANGVALDDIDPATGYNISECAYQNVRRSWVGNIKEHGWAGECRPESELPEVFAIWERRRPDLTADDSVDAWLKDGAEAHYQRWDASGVACSRPGCALHDEPSDLATN